MRERHACPFADDAPAFHAIVAGDLGARWHGAQCVEADLQWLIHHAADLELVVTEAVGLGGEVFDRLRIRGAVGPE